MKNFITNPKIVLKKLYIVKNIISIFIYSLYQNFLCN